MGQREKEDVSMRQEQVCRRMAGFSLPEVVASPQQPEGWPLPEAAVCPSRLHRLSLACDGPEGRRGSNPFSRTCLAKQKAREFRLNQPGNPHLPMR